MVAGNKEPAHEGGLGNPALFSYWSPRDALEAPGSTFFVSLVAIEYGLNRSGWLENPALETFDNPF